MKSNLSWNQEDISLVAWAEQEDAALETLVREKRYVVPKAPDRAAIDALYVSIVRASLG